MDRRSSGGGIMTVTGLIEPAELGLTDAHEHLFLRSPALPGDELEDVDAAIEEVAEAGFGAIVELTPIGLGRRPDLLREVSEVTGVSIIGATGFHRDAHYRDDHWVLDADDQTLVDRMVAEIQHGMHPSDWTDTAVPPDPARAGVIKAGASYQRISDNERRRLLAAAQASVTTGAPIVVHTEVGTCGDEIVDLLFSQGLAPDQIVLAHMDRNPDFDLHNELLGRGVFLVYDTIGRIKYAPDDVRLALVAHAFESGFGGSVLLGMDLGRREYFRAHGGGPGLGYLLDTFVPRLEAMIGADETRRILIDNAAHALTMAAPA